MPTPISTFYSNRLAPAFSFRRWVQSFVSGHIDHLAQLKALSKPGFTHLGVAIPEGYVRISLDEGNRQVDFFSFAEDFDVWVPAFEAKKAVPSLKNAIAHDDLARFERALKLESQIEVNVMARH